MRKYDFLIVGAGLFGAVCARELTVRGYSCAVIDKRDHIGGNCYTYKHDTIDVHTYGAHIFHTDSKFLWDYINNFGEFIPFINSPIAISHGKAYNLPFNMNTFAQLFGVTSVEDAKKRIASEQEEFANKEPQNLEEQAIKLVGKTIYHALIKGYTEKQWGRPCTELPASYIKRLPVRFTYDNNYFNDTYQGIPKDGYTKLFEGMLDKSHVFLQENHKTTKIKYDKMIYTGTIDGYFDYSLGKLEYRSLSFKHEVKDTENSQGNAVINYTDAEIPYTRTIEHKHFNRYTASKQTVVSTEFPCDYEDETQTPYYPIGQQHNLELFKKYQALAKTVPNVLFGGRLGSYRYFDMDDTIASALQLTATL